MYQQSLRYTIWPVNGNRSLQKVDFLPHDAMHSADFAVARCLSVCLVQYE